MKQIFQNHREQVLNAYPSVFTKEDVIMLINQIEKSIVDQVDQVEALDVENLKERLKEIIGDVVDAHDYDDNASFLVHSGRSIRLDFSSYELCRELEDAVDEAFRG